MHHTMNKQENIISLPYEVFILSICTVADVLENNIWKICCKTKISKADQAHILVIQKKIIASHRGLLNIIKYNLGSIHFHCAFISGKEDIIIQLQTIRTSFLFISFLGTL